MLFNIALVISAAYTTHELITCKFILESERLIILSRVTISGGMKADSIPGGEQSYSIETVQLKSPPNTLLR